MNIVLLLKWILALSMVFFLAACGGDSNKTEAEMANIRVGVLIGGTEEKLMNAVKKAAAKEGYDLNIEIIPYGNPIELNKALSDREIDANIFQYRAYLEYSEKTRGYHFSEIGHTFIYPMGVYSKKITNILQIKEGAVIAIPEEATNEARALFLLEKAGMIRLSSHDMNASIRDIAANPSNFQFKTLPANELLDVLPNVDAVVVNAGFVLQTGLMPSQHALVIENKNSAYSNIIVIREGEENEPRMKAFVDLFHSAEIEKAAGQIFKGQAIPAWK